MSGGRLGHGTRRPEDAMTIVEALIGVVLLAGLIGVAMQVVRSGTVQEKQLVEMSGMQREARKAIEMLERDIRGMAKLEALRRGDGGRLDTLVMLVPTSEDPTQEVRYAFNPAARVLTRNGDTLLQEALVDCQLWPFDSSTPPVEIAKAENYNQLSFFKVRITLARAPGETAEEANLTQPRGFKPPPPPPSVSGIIGGHPAPVPPGLAQRVFDFLVFPRLPNSIRKAKESALNQTNSRFATGQSAQVEE